MTLKSAVATQAMGAIGGASIRHLLEHFFRNLEQHLGDPVQWVSTNCTYMNTLCNVVFIL